MARRKKHPVRKVLLTLLLICIMTAAICGLAFAWYIHSYINPSIETLDLSSINLKQTSIIYARDPETGEFTEYEKLHPQGENRIWADFDEIPVYMGQAFVAVEDERFYTHHGVDWKRTAHAALGWVTGKGSFGGSTITQQLIKNVTNDKDYSIRRKINEIFRALALEKDANDDKDRILEMYMNTIPFGNSACGVQAAARTYFNKDVSELSLAECAAIAGITNAPTKYNPFVHPENTKERQEVILNKMLELGMISESQCAAAKAEALHYERPADETNQAPYSWFTDQIIKDVIGDLVERKGYSEQLAENIVIGGGLQIYATIDQNVQKTIDEVYADDANFPKHSHTNKTDGKTEYPESAMVVMKPGGAIAGLIGGRGEKEGSRLFNRATQAQRQPGSSFKPVSTYGPAMDAGLITPYTGMVDEPFKELDGKPWPRNDNGQYTGSIILKDAVARSVNTIAVKTIDLLTPQKSYDFLTQKVGMGGSLVTADNDYAPLALGGLTNGVTVSQMAGAYGIFINDGKFVEPYTYSYVKDSKGNYLLVNELPEGAEAPEGVTVPEPVQAFENVKTTYYMNETLQGVWSSIGTARQAKIPNMDTAGKTGTTTANRDRWFCGYTPYYVTACWVGYDNNYKLNGLSGNPATNLWKKVMTQIHEGLEPASFPKPGDGFSRISYCTKTGLLPVAGCETATGYFYKGDAPKKSCPGHVLENIPDTIDPSLIDPEAVKNEDGSYTNPDGTIIKPDGSVTKPDGTVTKPDGTVIKPDGTVVNPDGTVVPPTGQLPGIDPGGATPDGGAPPDGEPGQQPNPPGGSTEGGGNTGGNTGGQNTPQEPTEPSIPVTTPDPGVPADPEG